MDTKVSAPHPGGIDNQRQPENVFEAFRLTTERTQGLANSKVNKLMAYGCPPRARDQAKKVLLVPQKVSTLF